MTTSDTQTMTPRPQVDFLDPMLWAWIAKAKAVGESKGEWLAGVLRHLSNAATSESREELRRLERDDSLYISLYDTEWP